MWDPPQITVPSWACPHWRRLIHGLQSSGKWCLLRVHLPLCPSKCPLLCPSSCIFTCPLLCLLLGLLTCTLGIWQLLSFLKNVWAEALCVPLTSWDFGTAWFDSWAGWNWLWLYRIVLAFSQTSQSCSPVLPSPCQLCPLHLPRMDFGLVLLLHTHTGVLIHTYTLMFSWQSNSCSHRSLTYLWALKSPKCIALVLLATLFLRQARMPWMPWAFLASWAQCQLMIGYCQLAFPRPFLPDTFPPTLPWVCSSARDCCDPGESPVTGPFWRLIQLALAPQSSLFRFLCRAFPLSSRWKFPPSLVSFVSLLKVHSIPLFRSLINILNRPQNWTLENTTCHPPPTGFNTIHHNPLSSSSQPEYPSNKGWRFSFFLLTYL